MKRKKNRKQLAMSTSSQQEAEQRIREGVSISSEVIRPTHAFADPNATIEVISLDDTNDAILDQKSTPNPGECYVYLDKTPSTEEGNERRKPRRKKKSLPRRLRDKNSSLNATAQINNSTPAAPTPSAEKKQGRKRKRKSVPVRREVVSDAENIPEQDSGESKGASPSTGDIPEANQRTNDNDFSVIILDSDHEEDPVKEDTACNASVVVLSDDEVEEIPVVKKSFRRRTDLSIGARQFIALSPKLTRKAESKRKQVGTCSGAISGGGVGTFGSRGLNQWTALLRRGPGSLKRQRSPEQPTPSKTRSLRPIVIDGSNVAFGHGKDKFSSRGLEICVNYFTKLGHKVTAFVPQFRRRHMATTDQHILDDLEKKGIVVYTPSRRVNGRMVVSYDDRYIVEYAHQEGAVIVSRDNYKDLLAENSQWADTINNRLLMYTWINDTLMFPQDPLGRGGPTLQTFLSFPE